MSYRDWHVGMEIVAVRDGARHWPEEVRSFIVAGRAYRIAGINPSDSFEDDFPIYVVLEGGPIEDGEVAEFECRGFRPVQKRNTDISVFTAMLTGNKQRVDA